VTLTRANFSKRLLLRYAKLSMTAFFEFVLALVIAGRYEPFLVRLM
jgi:hypothetical protein